MIVTALKIIYRDKIGRYDECDVLKIIGKGGEKVEIK